MERLIGKIEILIDDLERDPQMTKTEILEELYIIKGELEDLNLNEEDYNY